MPNEPWKPGMPQPEVDKKLLAEARESLKNMGDICSMPYDGVVPNNRLHCTCIGMVPDPESVLHHVIGPYSSKPTTPE